MDVPVSSAPHFVLQVVLVICLLGCSHVPVEAVAPTFLVPDPTGTTAPRAVNENSRKDVSILTVEAEDSDGNTLTFSINSQTPVSPPFILDGSSGLFKTPAGLDAETSTQYTFTFSVTDGTTTVDSVAFTLNINDMNEFAPVFQNIPYSTSFINNANNGYTVFTVTATDADVTNVVTYTITAGSSAFAINSNTGVITVADKFLLTDGITYSLTVQASSGPDTTYATVSITVIRDLSNGNPCQNGGTSVISGNSNYTCICVAGFHGRNCSKVDHCYLDDPCENGTCVTMETGYLCNCTEGFTGQNCSQGVSRKAQCGNGWVTFNGKCYLFNDRVELTWDEAIGFCSNDAAQLVTIRSQEEYFFVQDYTRRLFKGGSNKGKWMWIGCSDKSRDGFWSWYTDGSLVRSGYSNWVSGEGDTGSKSGQDCGVLWGDDSFNWHDYYCDRKSHFICQKKAY